MKYAQLDISGALLREILMLPAGVTVQDIAADPNNDVFHLGLRGNGLPVKDRGEEIVGSIRCARPPRLGGIVKVQPASIGGDSLHVPRMELVAMGDDGAWQDSPAGDHLACIHSHLDEVMAICLAHQALPMITLGLGNAEAVDDPEDGPRIYFVTGPPRIKKSEMRMILVSALMHLDRGTMDSHFLPEEESSVDEGNATPESSVDEVA